MRAHRLQDIPRRAGDDRRRARPGSRAYEDLLAASLAESHNAVIHARFATDPAESALHFTKALAAIERSLATVVKRLQTRPNPGALIAGIPMAMLIGIGAVGAMLWTALRMPKTKTKE